MTNHLTIVKEVTLFFLLIGSFLASLAPWLIAKRATKAAHLFSLLNCLSGGVVIGAAFSHMLPDASESFDNFFQNHDASDSVKEYPWAFLCSAISLLILLSIEKIFMQQHGDHSHSEIPEDGQDHHHHHHHHHHNDSSHLLSEKEEDEHAKHRKPRTSEHSPLVNGEEVITIGTVSEDVKALEKESSAQAYVFLFALSVHSIFEGLGLGAESTPKGVYSVLIAVVSHKLLEAFALGLSVYRAQFPLIPTLVMLVGYAFATPLGILVGLVVGSIGDSGELVSGILTSLASGSFFYIALIEILPAELRKPKGIRVKLAMIVAGWAFMVIVAFWA